MTNTLDRAHRAPDGGATLRRLAGIGTMVAIVLLLIAMLSQT